MEDLLRRMRSNWLLARAGFWAQIATISAIRQISSDGDLLWRNFQNSHYGPIQTVSALWHLQRCLDNLEALGFEMEEPLKIVATALLVELKRSHIAEARDALEHMEDRVADVNMERFQRWRMAEPYGDLLPEALEEDGMLASVTVLDRQYRILESIKLALQAESLLTKTAFEMHTEISAEISSMPPEDRNAEFPDPRA